MQFSSEAWREHASLEEGNTELLCVGKAHRLPEPNKQGRSVCVCVSQDMSSKPQQPTPLSQGGMTQAPRLKAWESSSELSEVENDSLSSLAGGEEEKKCFLAGQPEVSAVPGDAACVAEALLGRLRKPLAFATWWDQLGSKCWKQRGEEAPPASTQQHLLPGGLPLILDPVPLQVLRDPRAGALLFFSALLPLLAGL